MRVNFDSLCDFKERKRTLCGAHVASDVHRAFGVLRDGAHSRWMCPDSLSEAEKVQYVDVSLSVGVERCCGLVLASLFVDSFRS